MAQNINEQLNLLSKSALDVRKNTLQSVSDLASYAYFTYAYDGLEVTVLNGGHPVKFTIDSNGSSRVRKSNWVISSTIVADTYQGLVDFCDNVVSTLSVSSSNKSKAFAVGQKAIVLADETRKGGWSEYIAVDVVDGIPTWEFNHVDVNKLSVSADSETSSVDIIYDGEIIGTADLTDILTEWQTDKFISSGAVVTDSGETFIELLYNDGEMSPIRINITNATGEKYTAGEGISISGDVISVVKSDMKDIALSALTEALVPESAKESLDTLEEISAWIQNHPEDAAEMNRNIGEVSAAVQTLSGAVESLQVGDKNIIEDVKVNGESLEVVDKSVNIVLSGYATNEFVENALTEYIKTETVETILSGYATTEFVQSSLTEYVKTEDVESALTDFATVEYVDNAVSGLAKTSDIEDALSNYATSADTVHAIEEAASKPAETAEDYSEAKQIAQDSEIGQIINVLNEEEDGSGTTYSAGLYIVTGVGEVSKLGTTSASGDLAGDVENLKGRVGTIETTLDSALYWEDPDELEY